MIERFAQFNLFEHVNVNNERLGVVVDFDYIVPILDEVASVETEQQSQDCGRAFEDVEDLIISKDEIERAIEESLELSDEQRTELEAFAEKRVLEADVIEQTSRPIVKNTNPNALAKSQVHMHMSNLNQFISPDMMNQVENELIREQVFYWILCEQDDNPVMAYVPEELVSGAKEEPSKRLLENLDVWRSQTNIQYRH